MDYLRLVIIVIGLVPASIIDIKTKKIPNYISFSLMGAGLVWGLIFNFNTLWQDMIAFLVLFILGIIGIMGIGDIKIYMGITLFCGWRISLISLFFAEILLFLFNVIVHPQKSFSALKHTMNAIVSLNFSSINKNEDKQAFAPYITVGFITAYILMAITKVLEVF